MFTAASMSFFFCLVVQKLQIIVKLNGEKKNTDKGTNCNLAPYVIFTTTQML